jgi:RND superfamily putative drug exporter
VFYKLGLILVARAKLVLAVSVIAAAVFAVLGASVFGRLLSSGFDDPASGSSQAKVMLDQKFGGEPDLIFLVHARSGGIDGPAATASGQALAQRLSGDTRLTGVTSYWKTHVAALRSRDGSDALILTKVVGDETAAGENAKALLADYAHLNDSAITVRIGGQLGTDVAGQVGKDLAVAEAIAVPIILILLIVAFGSLISALLPLGVSLIAILGTLAELSLLTRVTDVSIFSINLTTGLGLGLGIDYALLMVSRFREELAHGVDVPEAVARTMTTAGRTIAFSALTVAVALSAMLVFPVYFLKSFAYAGVGVTLLSAIAALIVLPALFAVLGHRVNAGRVPGIRTVRSPEAPFWGRLARGVMRRPALTALPVVAILLFMALPLLHVSFGTPDERVLPTSAASHQVGNVLHNDFATQPAVIDVLVSGPITQSALAGYARQLSSLDGVQRADSSAGSFTDGATATPGAAPTSMVAGDTNRISLSSGLNASSTQAQALVGRVRDLTPPSGTKVLVGGSTAVLIDAKEAIRSHLLIAAGLIVVTTFILLFLFTGSLVHPIRALLGNALTLAATMGVMVWIFQDGHLSSVLAFTPTPINTSMPVLLFCIAYGLSMDYEVFLMSRIKELHDSGSSTPDAVAYGLARTGRIVSTAAVLLAVSFFAFATSRVNFIQLFGLGTGIAILLDATLVRGILVPAFMRLFGEGSWYAPRVLRRLHNRIGLGEHEEPEPTPTPVG